MTRTNRLLAFSLLPILSSFSLAACSDDSPGSDTAAVGGTTGDGGNTNPGSGGAGTGPQMGGTTGDSGGTTGDSGGTTGDSGGTTGDSGGTTGDSGGATGDSGGATGDSGGTTGDSGGTTGDSGGTTGDSGGTTGEPVDGVHVQMDNTRQPIQGFGINTALMPGGSLPYDDMFGLEGPNAIGMSILRIGMNSSGNLTGQGIDEAKSHGAKIIGSTWTPPGNCKTDGTTDNGGHLINDDNGACYDSWSTTIANFAQQYDLYAMSIANESDFASCPGTPVCTVAYDTTVYTAKEMVEWVKVAGAKLKAVGVKVIAPEASEWIHVWGNVSSTGSLVASHPQSSDPLDCGCYGNELTEEMEASCSQNCIDGNGYDYGHWLWADQEAWNSFDIMGVHEYDSQIAYAWPADVNDGVRDKEVWQTEMSGVRHWPEEGPSTDIANGVAVAGWIHSAMTVGEASAWLYWWYEAYYENDNEGLALTQNSSALAKRYFTFGNYSKFVRPGFTAVSVAGDEDENLLISAYASEEGKAVVVIINKGAAAEFPITITGGAATTSMIPHVTSDSDNLAAGTAVPVADGVFTATLAPMTVTTFVGE